MKVNHDKHISWKLNLGMNFLQDMDILEKQYRFNIIRDSHLLEATNFNIV